MLRVIFRDLKNLFYKPLVAILLILGLIFASFSGVVYYISSTHSIRVSNTFLNQQKTIEISTFGSWRETQEQLSRLKEIIDDGTLPYVVRYSVVSYDLASYDLVGIMWASDGEKIEHGTGENITYKHSGQRVACVSADISDDKLALGDKIKILGNNFEIIGITSPSAYNPLFYDLRFYSKDTESVAGEEDGLLTKLSKRPMKTVYIPLDQLMEMEIPTGDPELAPYIHIEFAEELSDNQREEIQDLITSETGLFIFTDFSLYTDIDYYDVWGLLIIYAVAIIAAMANIAVLFSFYFSENRKNYATYKMLGATNGQIAAICIGEIVIITIICYLIGMSVGLWFVDYTNIIGVHLPFKWTDAMIVFAFVFFISMAMSLKTIIDISSNTVINVGKDTRRKFQTKHSGAPNEDSNVDVSTFKNMYLLSFRYSKHNIGKIISISALSLITAFCLTYAITYLLEGNRYSRFYEDNFQCNVYAVTITDEVNYSGMDATSKGLPPTNGEVYSDMVDAVYSLDNVKGIGKVTRISGIKSVIPELEDWAITEYGFTELVMVNSDFCEFAPLPLQQGDWDSVKNYDSTDEGAPIPCVLSAYYKNIYPIGTKLTYNVRIFEGYELDEHNQYVGSKFHYAKREFEVVGILSQDALDYKGLATGANGYSTLSGSYFSDFTKPIYSTNPSEEEIGSMTIYTPYITENGKELVQDWGLPLYLLYTDGANGYYNGNWADLLSSYGWVDSFDSCAKNDESAFNEAGGSLYYMHAALSSVMLILGAGSFCIILYAQNRRIFGVYYACGMPWSKSVWLLLSGNALDMLIPACIGAYLGIYVPQLTRLFSNYTIKLSTLIGISGVIFAYILSGIITVIIASREKNKFMNSL